MDALLFGLSGVALELRTPAALARVEQAAGALDPERFWAVYRDLRPSYNVGDVSDVRWWQQVALRAGIDDIDVHEAVAADVDTLLEPRRAVVECLLELVDDGWTCGIVDNAPPVVASHLRSTHPWLGELDAVTFSCDIGVAKPDAAAYRVAVDAMGAKLTSTVYFDHREQWVEAAAELGMRAILFTDPDDVRKALA
ncbi:HAD hydrolase-like protein [Corynebacterium sanguinis]|uniref:HAD family hydrolase n=1 Tax=Corynebacterium sanguinis TaxID=2594913 RepID=UPI00223B8D85|nr:HAD family hydrolase [Corynebacterium sanguinis]MCT2023906.1 HAD hydrolase-like protein [Corynebacterium sanguinis]